MIEIANAINSFLPGAQEAYSHVPPLNEHIFILSSGQLQEIISKAIQPLQDRVESLESLVASQNER